MQGIWENLYVLNEREFQNEGIQNNRRQSKVKRKKKVNKNMIEI